MSILNTIKQNLQVKKAVVIGSGDVIQDILEEIKASGVEPLFMPILGELYFDQNNQS